MSRPRTRPRLLQRKCARGSRPRRCARSSKLGAAVRMLKQAQALNRVLKTRLLGLTDEKNGVLRRYKGCSQAGQDQ